MSGYRFRLTLFLGPIVGPAGVLTFLSLRAALDEQRKRPIGRTATHSCHPSNPRRPHAERPFHRDC